MWGKSGRKREKRPESKRWLKKVKSRITVDESGAALKEARDLGGSVLEDPERRRGRGEGELREAREKGRGGGGKKERGGRYGDGGVGIEGPGGAADVEIEVHEPPAEGGRVVVGRLPVAGFHHGRKVSGGGQEAAGMKGGDSI